ncbi:hypothetical protein [Streptomyces litchfieldiae]|uniref:Uncharacterized protein n=1 Tax=Streptomyces litchfieldiae TaxID=3075543 RepID=A0ABU2MQX7_9ACTN|nr:hypothetical protein [Streptomyces sp. DSM 44938]MDT0344032.1 hypothetical protein [Streptomyces sp. DSM 44938]
MQRPCIRTFGRAPGTLPAGARPDFSAVPRALPRRAGTGGGG